VLDARKIQQLRALEAQGIVQEMCPEEAYWRFRVEKPEMLPPEMLAEYKIHGEIRW